MSLYLEEGAAAENAVYESRKKIQDLMLAVNGTSAVGVVNATYLGPNLKAPSNAQSSNRGDIIEYGNSSTLTPAYTALIAIGGLVMIATVLVSYRYRGRRGGKDGGALTVAAGSDLTTADTSVTAYSAPKSPFSAMLPSPYRLDQDPGMSAILEDDSDSASHAHSSDIIVSESGYTTDDCDSVQSSNEGYFSYLQSLTDAAPTLGARKMGDESADDDYLFDTGSDTVSVADGN
jgi:hypothetical protein